ncbi:MAG: DEAD/DEAH box helicase family protein, partial [Proteobacteria bacterium]|nr:DEAD/DEAH box helicase family protein [Pseudomonadota bacterium]
MNKHVEDIAERLSLRDPQLYSLEILAWVADNISLAKDADVDAALQKISGKHGTVTDFERDFPSLCFALATGVGKTRLMGAAIAYLYAAKGMKNFFVLAPNLTIYKKLITDFTAGTSKYVFNGLAEFIAHTPQIITAENYENRGGLSAPEDYIHINIFNISKINSEVRGDKAPRIKRMSEYIGQSYFEKLAGQDDLVLLMDESHRYRASAGIKAINELRPVLGIELTATPQVERGQNPIPFKNVIYDYPLYKAMNDEFVKEPAVATRENFDPDSYDAEGLEEKKLQDGIIIHEDTRIALDIYAKNNNKIQVKPFMLVIARDINHAKSLRARIEQDNFCEGYYQGRVITVDSSQTGAEKDENIDLLLSVEDPENPTEIVIHVNMLKEGWDVTNLYTIVPLRAAHSRTLVEQAIGRGLRLPYGKRTGVDA